MKNKYITAVRPLHWVKNLIVFVPVLTAHQIGLVTESTKGIVIFFAMSFFASAGYLVNDFCDKEDDRLNSYKKNRAYASGGLSKNELFGLSGLFFVAGVILSLSLSILITIYLLFYLSVSVLYSSLLKKFFILDILLITFFFLFRIFIGHEVFNITYSSWLFAYAFFFFFSLASIKRVAELQNAKGSDKIRAASRRAYIYSDLPVIVMFGVASSFIAILILALYIQSPAALKLYMHVEMLWLLCPVLLYWMYRLWLLSYRGEIQRDPMNFILSDPISYICLIVLGATLFGSI